MTDSAFPSANKMHLAFFTEHQRHTKLGIFCAQSPGYSTKRPLGWGNEIVFLGLSVAVFHGSWNIVLSWLVEQVSDSATKRGGLI